MSDNTAPLDLTPGKIQRDINTIVEQSFPVPRGENCMPVSEMEQALIAYVNDLVHAIYAEEKTRRAGVDADLSAARTTLDGIGDLAYRFGQWGEPTEVRELLETIGDRAKRAARGEW